MTKTLRKIGHWQGLIFDAALMALARLKVGDQVNVEIHDGGIITLTPLRPRLSRQKVSKVIDSTMKDYTHTMKKLA